MSRCSVTWRHRFLRVSAGSGDRVVMPPIRDQGAGFFDRISTMKIEMKTIAQKQQGVALVISLMILMLVAVLGISAMRLSLFNAKIATSAQADTLAFQAAESAITAAYREARDDTDVAGSIVNAALTAFSASGAVQIQSRCVTSGDVKVSGLCGSSDFLDSRDLVRAQSETILTGQRVAKGYQVSYTGAGTVNYGYYEFLTAGTGEVPNMNISHHNVQEFTKFGPLVGPDM